MSAASQHIAAIEAGLVVPVFQSQHRPNRNQDVFTPPVITFKANTKFDPSLEKILTGKIELLHDTLAIVPGTG